MPVATARRVAVVAQSGGMGFALFNRGRALGLGFSSVVSTGNEADLTVADFLQHAADDADTGGVLMFVETIRDPAGFRAAAESAAAAGKPVVAIKIGRSAVGQLAAASHTAALAGWDAGYDAMFRRHGITVAADLDEALAVMGALMTNPRAEGNRVAILTVSGGAGALAADALSLAGLDVPELSEASQAAIRSFIPSYGSARNPVDLTAQGAHGGGMLRATALLLDDPAVDMVAIVTSLANPARVSLIAADLRELIAPRRKPVLIHSYTLPSELGRKTVAEAGAVVLPSMTLLGAAARALAQQQPAARLPVAKLPPAASARLDSGPLSEHAVKALLAQCGVVIAPSRLVKEAAGLDAAAAELGFPLALKIQSPDIIHKTELGGVRLGIADRDALHAAYAAVLEAARHAPAARIEGVLLEPMAANGTEWIIGIVRDPVAGPVLTVGAGGTQAELLRDVARRVAPVDEAEAAAMLQELRSAPLLHGFRGRPLADVPALTRLIAQVSALAAASDRIMELELNPVIVHAAGQGCTIADALLALRPAGGS
jgi:acyl-CoA synthetase (NDP forming)